MYRGVNIIDVQERAREKGEWLRGLTDIQNLQGRKRP